MTVVLVVRMELWLWEESEKSEVGDEGEVGRMGSCELTLEVYLNHTCTDSTRKAELRWCTTSSPDVWSLIHVSDRAIGSWTPILGRRARHETCNHVLGFQSSRRLRLTNHVDIYVSELIA